MSITQVLSTAQEQSDQLLEQAKQLYTAGRLTESEALFQQVIASGSNTAMGLFGVGMVRISRGDDDTGATFFARVLQADPRNAGALYELGRIMERQQKTDLARSFFDRALAANPRHAGARARLAALMRSSVPPPARGPSVSTVAMSHTAASPVMAASGGPLTGNGASSPQDRPAA